MTTLRRLVLLLGVLLPALMAHAQDWVYYEVSVCNDGKITFDVATVEKKLSDSMFSNSWSWKARGWMPVDPDSCVSVWSTRRWESGFTTDHPAVYLVVAFRDSTGVWGRAGLELRGTKERDEATDQEICVKQDAFEYDLPSGRISGDCKAGYQPMQASLFFDRAPTAARRLGSEPYKVHIGLTKEDRAIKFGGTAVAGSTPTSSGSGASSTGSTLTVREILAGVAIVAGVVAALTDTPKPFARGTLTASLLGKKIARWANTESNWYYEDGSQVNPAWGLEGKKASWLLDAPEQRPTSDPDVDAAWTALMRPLAKISLNRIPRMQIARTGRLAYASTLDDSEYDETVNLSALDYGKATYSHGSRATFEIPCREGSCVAVQYHGKIELRESLMMVFAVGDDKAVWDPLMKLVDLYPAEPTVAVR